MKPVRDSNGISHAYYIGNVSQYELSIYFTNKLQLHVDFHILKLFGGALGAQSFAYILFSGFAFKVYFLHGSKREYAHTVKQMSDSVKEYVLLQHNFMTKLNNRSK